MCLVRCLQHASRPRGSALLQADLLLRTWRERPQPLLPGRPHTLPPGCKSANWFAPAPHAPSLGAEFVDIGSGAAAGLTACSCGHISSFQAGFVTIGGTPYIATVGFTCSSGESQPDPAAAGLSLSSSATTQACPPSGCASASGQLATAGGIQGIVGFQDVGALLGGYCWVLSGAAR